MFAIKARPLAGTVTCLVMAGTETSLPESRPLGLDDSIFKLCLKLFGLVRPTGNLCFSPAGIHQVLSLLATVCEGTDTKRKLIELLGLSQDFQLQEFYDEWDTYLTSLRATTDRPLDVSLGLFSLPKIQKDEKRLVKDKLHCELIPLDQENYKYPVINPEDVNSWIERATAGIKKEININLRFVHCLLVSVFHFIGEFRNNLEWEVQDSQFSIGIFSSVRTVFMQTKAYIQYAENSDLQAVKLEYENPDYYLLILRPKDQLFRTNQLEKKLNSSAEYFASLKFENKLVSLFIPKFLIQNELDILAILHQACPDINNLFVGRECVLTHINAIKQMNRIDVREQKSASSSCSRKSSECNPNMILFNADQPFVYMICHKDKIIFAGRFCNPLDGICS